MRAVSEKRARAIEAGEVRTAPGSTLPARTKPMSRGKRIRRKPRSAEEFARIYHSLERVYFVSMSLSCLVPTCEQQIGEPNENHHTENEGMGRKGGYRTVVPLCTAHHRECHAGRLTFEERHGVDLVLAAVETERAWQLYGADVVAQAKADGRFQAWAERWAA